jgi:hypothetical protein
MLKRITLTALFIISTAFAISGTATARTAPKKDHKTVVTPSAPQGFCWPCIC